MRVSQRLSMSGIVVLLAGCVHPSWQRLASQAAVVQQARTNPSSAVSCEPEAAVLGDYAYSISCRASTVYVRCGYHHGTACCWPVETRAAATGLFGQSNHAMTDQVCGPL